MKRTASALRWVKRFAKPATHYLTRPQAVFWRDRVATSADGLHFWCHPENRIERTLLRTGLWEPWETAMVKNLVLPGSTVFDIGANVGYFSLLLCQQVGEAGKVHAFEPTNYGYSRFLRNIELNSQLPVRNITAVKRGLLATPQRREIALEARFSQRRLAHTEPEEIEFTTLDAYWTEVGSPSIAFIKIDVDGHDAAVILGAGAVLDACRPWVLAEFCDRVLRANGSSVPAYAECFASQGYDRFVDDCTPVPQPLSLLWANDKYHRASHSLVLLPSGREFPKQLLAHLHK